MDGGVMISTSPTHILSSNFGLNQPALWLKLWGLNQWATAPQFFTHCIKGFLILQSEQFAVIMTEVNNQFIYDVSEVPWKR